MLDFLKRSKKSDFPRQVQSPSGKVYPVSIGGIVRVDAIEDVMVLAQDGITAVELRRKLSDAFYAANSAPNDDLFLEPKQVLRLGDVNKIKLLDEQEHHNPFSKQIIRDTQQFETLMQDLDAQISKESGIARIFSRRSTQKQMDVRNIELVRLTGYHADPAVLRGVIAYSGQTTKILDARLSADEIRELAEFRDGAFAMQGALSFMPYHYADIGNPVFIKGTKSASSDAELVRNVSIHSQPNIVNGMEINAAHRVATRYEMMPA